MDNINYFKDLFEPIPDFREVVFSIVLIKYDVDILQEYGCLKNDDNHLCKKLKL